jgi:hypothetical protein
MVGAGRVSEPPQSRALRPQVSNVVQAPNRD